MQLFETGVDEMSWDDLSQSRNDWPTIRECHAYRKAAYDIIIKLLEVRVVWQQPLVAWSYCLTLNFA
jgi:hypothetical protein